MVTPLAMSGYHELTLAQPRDLALPGRAGVEEVGKFPIALVPGTRNRRTPGPCGWRDTKYTPLTPRAAELTWWKISRSPATISASAAAFSRTLTRTSGRHWPRPWTSYRRIHLSGIT